MAVTVVVALLGAGAYVIRRQQNPALKFRDDLVSDYLHSLPEVRPAEVTSTDPREILAFFSGKTPFAAVVPAVPSAQLVGARLCNVAGRRAELLFYTYGASGHKLSIFVYDRAVADTGCHEHRGYNVCSRRSGNLTFIAIGEVPGHTLEQLLREATL